MGNLRWSDQVIVVVLLLLLLVLGVLVILLVVLVVSPRKSNVHAHTLDWCACALDGGKKRDQRTDGQGVSRSRMSVEFIAPKASAEGACI